jgi:hypothetical protein
MICALLSSLAPMACAEDLRDLSTDRPDTTKRPSLVGASNLKSMKNDSLAQCLTYIRPLSTDRPDTTESPYSVDKGHVQIEAELLSYGRDKVDDITTSIWASSLNLKYGLTDRVDLQVIGEHLRVSSTDSDAVSGFGDLTVRLKYNCWGQGPGDQPTAFALMPYVTLPTHGEKFDPLLGNDPSFGLIAPLGFGLPNGWSSTVMAQLDVIRNRADDGWTSQLLLSMTAGHAITADTAGFVELVSISRAERDETSEAYCDFGLTHMLDMHDRIQLDVGANVGLTRDSEDLRIFTGFSMKF